MQSKILSIDNSMHLHTKAYWAGSSFFVCLELIFEALGQVHYK